jgi:hypothetical protein
VRRVPIDIGGVKGSQPGIQVASRGGNILNEVHNASLERLHIVAAQGVVKVALNFQLAFCVLIYLVGKKLFPDAGVGGCGVLIGKF